MRLKEYLDSSYTAYQAVENAKKILEKEGFLPLKEGEKWALSEGGKYFVERNGSSLIAFKIGTKDYFKIVASHTDSPCLKIKENAEMKTGPYTKWNVETYGGGVWYSFFDRPLKVAGRVIVKEGDKLTAKNVVSDYVLTIPSLAVHMNRGVNEGFAVNAQTDLLPLVSLTEADPVRGLTDEEVVSYDLYLASAEAGYVNGQNGDFFSSPRIDNLTSVLSSILALTKAEGDGVSVAAIFDNEEIGSSTLQGANSDFLARTLAKITNDETALARSFMLSVDNAHSIHPNHPEKCDPTNHPAMGGGIVIKAHANHAYTTDALSSAIVKTIFEKANVKYQTFFNRSDMRSGGTLGVISQGQVSILTADIGLAQLAMHSAVETVSLADFDEMVNGVKAFYNCKLFIDGQNAEVK